MTASKENIFLDPIYYGYTLDDNEYIMAYGLDTASLYLLKNYLSNSKQKTKVGSSYSDWFEYLCEILQCSILGPLLFSIFVMTYFLKYKNQTFVTLQVIIGCIFVAKTYKLILKT